MLLLSALKQSIAVLATVFQSLDPWNEGNDVCNTVECQNAAKEIIIYNNPDVKPCDNFYQFACGNYMKGRDFNAVISVFGVMELKIDRQIKNLLQEEPKRSEPPIFRFVKRYFQLCMDENKMDDRGAAPGLAMLEKLRGWPVLGNWDSANWNIVDAAIGSWQQGLSGYNVIQLGIDVDPNDSTKKVFKVDQPELPIPRGFLVKGKDHRVVKEYFQFMVDMAMLFGADGETAEKAMENVLQLQIDLAQIVVADEQRRGIQHKIKTFTLQELDEDPNKELDWRKLFEGMASPTKLQDDQKINFYDLEVIQKILKFFKGYPVETVANYVMWNFAITMSPYLTTEMRNKHNRLDEMLRGSSGRLARWRECMVEVTAPGLAVAVSAIYVKKFFDKTSRNKAKSLAKEIHSEMDQVIREADWMDEETRKKAQQKSAKIRHVIGYPDELTDMTKVEEYYKELNIKEEHFFETQMALNTFCLKSYVKNLNVGSVKRHWSLLAMATEANAGYDPTINLFVAAAGILQEPMFSASRPSYLNYASVGSMIGHEITHAFDDQGREYNAEGDLEEWWDEASLNKFNEKKQCFIDQYSSFIESMTKHKVNGVNTQGENIADNGGLKLAYRAYRRQAQLKKPEPGLPGLKHYSNDQLFFIKFANTWCTAMRFESMVHSILTDEHAPPEWRVNGMVINMPEFGELFGCDKGTPMNPREKCEVW